MKERYNPLRGMVICFAEWLSPMANGYPLRGMNEQRESFVIDNEENSARGNPRAEVIIQLYKWQSRLLIRCLGTDLLRDTLGWIARL